MSKTNLPLAYICLLFSVLILLSSCSNKRPGSPKVLVFSKTDGYRHASIEDGKRALLQLGAENGFEVDTTENAAYFTEDSLKNYSAVVYLSTTGDVLDKYQEADFERYIQAGGGFAGIHAAADSEHHWGWYGHMVGSYFLDHPGMNDPHPNVQPGTLLVEDSTHAATRFLPNPWQRTDEWYSYESVNDNIHVLLTIDEESYQGGADMGYHPMAWSHEYDGGRAFYTGLGHTAESFSEELFLQHVLEGIRYAIGDNEVLDYSQVTTERVPEADRLVKTPLVRGQLYEPTEMTILPNNDVLIVERRGDIHLYDSSDSTLKPAGSLDVYHYTDHPRVNAEEGLLGIKIDPNFDQNRKLFLFYSPVDTSVNRLSRFTFENDQVVMDSEEVILEFYSQRGEVGNHTAGSIAFDSDGLLYLSTGDNVFPFNQENSNYTLNGFAPIDDRPSRRHYNALRSSANTNDLRGKILRIHVNEDGTYDIPEGNLFPEGMEGTRPEIYTMGHRNPYRISLDPKTNYLYWGEVGNDAPDDSLDTRGPRGYDEINQAREAGNYGWPMFVGNNYAYYRYDFDTGITGEAYNSANPINDSRLNTGIRELPPAQAPMIWYPYAPSVEFPELGAGSRNAMAGPVYYSDLYPEATRLPDYYNGKLFIYDWMRDWIKLVTMDSDERFSKLESFMPDIELNHLIDMEVGPGGQLYLLEYGSQWFAQNADAGLSRIDYIAGNRPPIVDDLVVTPGSGLLPLEVTATVDAYDPEEDNLSYLWTVSNGTTATTSEPYFEYTFETVGEYTIAVAVSDGLGQTVQGPEVLVFAGNAAPEVTISIDGNSTFYFPGKPVSYSVAVADDGMTLSSEDISDLYVTADYVEGSDLVEASQGHQIMTDVMRGRHMVESLDCQGCHQVDSESIGPSYMSIARRYRASTGVKSYLADKIISGGSDVWGSRMMPAHQDVSGEEAGKMAAWIQSLAGDQQNRSLPANGELDPSLGKTITPNGALILTASYTDRGDSGVRSLTGNDRVTLVNNTMNLTGTTDRQNYEHNSFGGSFALVIPQVEGAFSLGRAVDLTGVSSVELMTGARGAIVHDYQFELRLNSPKGPIIGDAVREADPPTKGYHFAPLTISLNTEIEPGKHELYFVSRPVDEPSVDVFVISSISFHAE